MCPKVVSKKVRISEWKSSCSMIIIGRLYTLAMGLGQLRASKIHSNFNLREKILKIWKGPSFLSFYTAENLHCLLLLHSISRMA